MTPRVAKLAVCAFVVACAGVWWNLMYLQRGTYSATYARALPSEAAVAEPTRASEPSGRPASSLSAAASAPSDAGVVRAVQRELAQRGYYPGSIDGLASPVTRASVMAFEHDQGLPVTGEPSEELFKAMLFGVGRPSTGPAPGNLARSAQPDEVIRSVQLGLAKLGYGGGRPDGRMGEETARAIRRFEIDQGMPATGRVSGALLVKLTEAAGKPRT